MTSKTLTTRAKAITAATIGLGVIALAGAGGYALAAGTIASPETPATAPVTAPAVPEAAAQ